MTIELATLIGFEPTISTLTGCQVHELRYACRRLTRFVALLRLWA